MWAKNYDCKKTSVHRWKKNIDGQWQRVVVLLQEYCAASCSASAPGCSETPAPKTLMCPPNYQPLTSIASNDGEARTIAGIRVRSLGCICTGYTKTPFSFNQCQQTTGRDS